MGGAIRAVSNVVSNVVSKVAPIVAKIAPFVPALQPFAGFMSKFSIAKNILQGRFTSFKAAVMGPIQAFRGQAQGFIGALRNRDWKGAAQIARNNSFSNVKTTFQAQVAALKAPLPANPKAAIAA